MMADRHGAPITVGARVRFRVPCGDKQDPTWRTGTVRSVRTQSYYQRFDQRLDVVEALVDDGDPGNADLQTNGFSVAAWVEENDLEVT